MKKTANSIALLVTLLVGSLSTAAPAITQAAAPAPAATPGPAGQALEIAPPVMTLNGNPGQKVVVQINLRDVASDSLNVTNQVNDFVAAGEDGTPKILLDNKEEDPYSMKSWFATIPSFLMIPRQIKTLPVTINVPANASPGGHYAVIRFTGKPPTLNGTGVSLSASLGALVLFTVNGKTTEKLSVDELSVSHNGKTGTLLEAAPLTFTEKFKNSGNIHEEPTGQVVIKDMFGKTVGAVNINTPPRNILPQSIRKFSQPFDSTVIGNKKLFGHYHADLKVTYGANHQVLTTTLAFWVLPIRLIITVIVVLVVGFFALRFLLRRYNQSIIRRAQGSNTAASKPKKPKKK